MTLCSKCGDCCDPVTLSVSTWQTIIDDDIVLETNLKNEYTREFARQYWHPIARTDNTMLVKCDFFDKVNRLCTAYEQRPAICSDFPWYGKEPGCSHNFPARCAFNADIGQPVHFVRKGDLLA